MGRRPRNTERVLGPYKQRKRWCVHIVAPDGVRETEYFASEARAKEWAAYLRAQVATEVHTTETARDAYLTWLAEVKGNKPASRKRTDWSLSIFFPEPLPLWGLTERQCRRAYETLAAKYAVDSHRNALAETKTWLDWCVERRFVRVNPATNIKGVGRRHKGKPQLRIKEARAWYTRAIELAEWGDDGAVAALLTVVLGVRASEVVTRVVRDLDEYDVPGDLLWIPDSKTPAGKRTLEVPEELRGPLVALAEGKGPTALLFPGKGGKPHWRDWVRKQVQRICEDAGVPKVTAHGMRGLHASVALRGRTGREVANQLGHVEVRTTREAYADRDSQEQTARDAHLGVLRRRR